MTATFTNNMRKVFVDTSAFVALFSANDSEHEKAVSIYSKLKYQKSFLYTSDYIVDETITTVLYRSNKKSSLQAAEALLNSDIVKIIPVYQDYFSLAFSLYKKHNDKKFSFTDTTSFVIMRELMIQKVFSFDSDFYKAGFEIVE